jgi:hypothetical protein
LRDALNDFIAELSSKQQHDPNRLRTLRILVETLFYLKQATVSYHSDGTRKGIKAVSATTLVDLIDTAVVPLGRPVLGVTKKIYVTDEEEEVGDDDITCVSFNDELERMIDTDLYVAPKDAIAEWSNQRKFLQEFAAPWTPIEEDDMWTAITDTDFFREIVPEIDEDGTFSITEDKYRSLSECILNFSPPLHKVQVYSMGTRVDYKELLKEKGILQSSSSSVDHWADFNIPVSANKTGGRRTLRKQRKRRNKRTLHKRH